MGDNPKTIEKAARTDRNTLPGDYYLARQLTLAGSSDEATRIYCQILAEAQSSATRAIVQNDLASIAAAAGDEAKARELLEEALLIDPQCIVARQNAIALGMQLPTNSKGGQAVFAPKAAHDRHRDGAGPVPDRTGLLCEPDNPDDLAEKLSQLLDSTELRISMGNAGRQRFVSECSWDVVIDRHHSPLLGLKSRTSKHSVAGAGGTTLDHDLPNQVPYFAI